LFSRITFAVGNLLLYTTWTVSSSDASELSNEQVKVVEGSDILWRKSFLFTK
jgi:hypothetical protein